MEHLQPPQTPDTPPKLPPRATPKTPIDRGRRPPRLVLPTPNSPLINSPSPLAPSLASKTSNPAYLYPSRKESYFVGLAKSGLSVGEKSTFWIYNKIYGLSRRWFTHCFLSIVLALYTVGGAALFVYVEGNDGDISLLSIRITEGNGEKVIEDDSREARYKLIDDLRELILPTSKNSEGEVPGKAAIRIEEFEIFVIDAYKKKMFLMENRSGVRWSFFNAVVYCSTIFTTIGYGHMYPTTTTGRALTIVYALIGIPLFLIALTDFGKFFTRCIKFLWSFVRRVYYTGSCRTVRKTAHVEDILQGAQMMYEIATLRRPSMFAAAPEEDPEKGKDGTRSLNSTTIGTDTPTTPAPSNFEIDDEFNLPISVAILILVIYIFLGAVMYCTLEKEWDFFASFYFVFISLSTIGFGDYVPTDPFCVILSIVYLVFGLALMSMCINVVQVKLSDTFKDASSKLGATIGLNVNEDDGSIGTVAPSPVEVPEIHLAVDKDASADANENKSGKKEKKSSLKVSKAKDEKEDEDEIKPPKEVKF